MDAIKVSQKGFCAVRMAFKQERNDEMAYTKQYFKSGQVLTAEQMNHIESGIENNDAEIAKLKMQSGNSGGSVTSVNGKTGAVTLSASDVGAATSAEVTELSNALNEKQPKGDYALKSEIPTKTSELTNDSGFLTSIPSEYVTDTELSNALDGLQSSEIPDYWLSELEAKADAIQTAMEKAGRNKSAFLWYTDAHWANGNSKVSPKLLNYLYMNTPMNKVNFGGDIIGNSLLATRDEMTYLYEWRKAIKDLPNHHSVVGNHDLFVSDSVDYEGANFAYSFLIAPEETSDMVAGGDFYYYIDNPSEKTRYLYLNSGQGRLYTLETIFTIDALKSVPADWHIVVISHIWFQYDSASEPSVGSMNTYMQKVLDLFDAYNARETGTITMASQELEYDFTSCGGKVEFCIGGHCHIDLDLSSNGGIPVILTASDVNQERSDGENEESGVMGTITESAVFGIIADYNDSESTKITVIGVGRGTSRVVNPKAKAVNLFDSSDSNVLLRGRINSSGNAVDYGDNQLVTGYIEAKVGDIFTVTTDKANNANGYTGNTSCYNTDKTFIPNTITLANTTVCTASDNNLSFTITIPSELNGKNYTSTGFVRFCVAYTDINSVVITKN